MYKSKKLSCHLKKHVLNCKVFTPVLLNFETVNNSRQGVKNSWHLPDPLMQTRCEKLLTSQMSTHLCQVPHHTFRASECSYHSLGYLNQYWNHLLHIPLLITALCTSQSHNNPLLLSPWRLMPTLYSARSGPPTRSSGGPVLRSSFSTTR